MDRGIVLASASPRRKELLESWGLFVDVTPAQGDVERAARDGEDPGALVLANATFKFVAVAANALRSGRVVLAADTVVALDDMILGKAADEAEAARMLEMLSGREHIVHTGVVIGVAAPTSLASEYGIGASAYRSFVETARVRFRALSGDEIAQYLATGEWRGRAGAYSVQDRARTFVAAIAGEIETVIGLPRARTLACLQAVQDELVAQEVKRP